MNENLWGLGRALVDPPQRHGHVEGVQKDEGEAKNLGGNKVKANWKRPPVQCSTGALSVTSPAWEALRPTLSLNSHLQMLFRS